MDMKERLAKELREKRAADQAAHDKTMERIRQQEADAATKALRSLMIWLDATEAIISALIQTSPPQTTAGLVALGDGYACIFNRRGVGPLNKDRLEGQAGEKLVNVPGGERFTIFDGDKAIRDRTVQEKIESLKVEGISFHLFSDSSNNPIFFYDYKGLLHNN